MKYSAAMIVLLSVASVPASKSARIGGLEIQPAVGVQREGRLRRSSFGRSRIPAVSMPREPKTRSPARLTQNVVDVVKRVQGGATREGAQTIYTKHIGSTPLVELRTLSPRDDVRILLKCEFLNPGYSIKDRIAEHILNEAERKGEIQPGGTVCVASSGNTAAAFSMLCAARGYKCVAITNTKCSKEKVDALRAYGATTIVTKAGVPPDHPEHYQNVEKRLCEENEGWFGVNQYGNPLNPDAYYHTIAPEIWEQSEGEVTHFFAAASTGGTVSGIGRYLKEQNPDLTVVCPDPVGSIFNEYYTKGTTEHGKSFQVEGVGKDNIPSILNFDIIDAMPLVTDKEAFAMCHKLSEQEGLVCGGSTGLNVHAAVEYAKTVEGPATIVCIAPDSGIKYLSKIYNDEWMEANGFTDDKSAEGAQGGTKCMECFSDPPMSCDNLPELMEVAVPPLGMAPPILSRGGSAAASAAPPAEPIDLPSPASSSSSARATSFIEQLSPKMLDYLSEVEDASKPVVQLVDPEELTKAFKDESGVDLSIALDKQPAVDNESLLKAADAIMKYSVRTGSPTFNNQLYGGVDQIGMAGEWLSTMLNTNVHTYEVAPVFTVMEKMLVDKIAAVLGGDFADSHEGMTTPGGSMANMYAMQLARHKAAPETKTGGNGAVKGGKTLVALTSDEAHYSYQKASNLLGLGTDNLVKVKCDSTGAMDPQALDEALTALHARGDALPFFVGATAGTTVLGAFDPFDAIAEVCAKHGVWLHVDGAWGGAALFSGTHRHLLQGANKADSFAWNPHKLMGAPLQTSIFVNKHPGLLTSANSANAQYLFQKDKNNNEFDVGDKTVMCGRHADQLKLWLMWKALGDEGFEARVDHNVGLITHMNERIHSITDKQGRPCFLLVAPSSFANLCFYMVPPSMRDELAGVASAADLTADQRSALSTVAPVVKDRMQRSGSGLIGFQPVNGFSNCWRMVIAGAKEALTYDGIDAILDDMLALGDDL